jgi:prevent-host-death family protein
MSRIISSTELQKNTRGVIDWARNQGEPIIVETYGRRMVAILDVSEYDELLRIKQAHIQHGFQQAVHYFRQATRDRSPRAVNALIAETREAVRAEQLVRV